MSSQHDPGRARTTARRDRRILTVLIAGLLGTAVCFRLMYLSRIPGISGDEGWWGVQALAWLSNRPYEARTTSGNPIDLFFLVPVALVHAMAPPSFLLLRAIPALVNLLALPVGYWFVRRLYGTTTAWIHTVALASMPTAIAHSRLCQDPSQSVFWTGIGIYLSLLGFGAGSRWWIYGGAAVLVFPVILLSHPANVFIAPFLVLPFAAAVGARLPITRRGRAILAVAVVVLLALGLLVVRTVLTHLAGTIDYLDKPWLSMAAARMTDGAQWFEFAANNARLFNGVTIYHYFSGARPATVPYDAAVVIVVAAALWGLVREPAGKQRSLDSALILACVFTWIGFYAFAGPQALRPHFERWGLCLIVPATLVAARGATAWIESMPGTRWPAIAAAALVAASWLTTFYVHYFREFATTGGRSHLTYVTAATEPKQQALEHILSEATGPGGVTILTQQWWLYFPIRYLATVHPNVSVRMGLTVERPQDLQEAIRNGRLFLVEFAETPELAGAIEWIHRRGLNVAGTTVRNAGGRDLLMVLRVSAAP
jgi:hypothetical protein